MNKIIKLSILFLAIGAYGVYLGFNSQQKHLETSANAQSSQDKTREYTTYTSHNPEVNNQNYVNDIDSGHPKNTDSAQTQLFEDTYELVNQNPAYPSLNSRLNAIRDRRPNTSINPEQLVKALAKSSAWESTKYNEKAHKHLSRLNIKNSEVMQFDRTKIESLVIGDTLDIPIKQTGETYKMRIASVQQHNEGNLTWRGNIYYEGKNYRASFTQNNSGLTIGGINTPQGHFTLEAHNDYGWISNSHANIQGSLEQDYIIPPIN